MSNHDPYKDPAFYDPAEKQLVDSPLKARSMFVKDRAELEQENQTLGERDYSLPPKTANIELVLRDHEARLVELIRNYQAAVGCVAWVISEEILGALASLDAAALVVQKDDRPRSLRLAREYQAYRQLKPFALDEISGGFAHMERASVRCVGVATKGVHAYMHHKFIVVGRLRTYSQTVRNAYTNEEWGSDGFARRPHGSAHTISHGKLRVPLKARSSYATRRSRDDCTLNSAPSWRSASRLIGIPNTLNRSFLSSP